MANWSLHSCMPTHTCNHRIATLQCDSERAHGHEHDFSTHHTTGTPVGAMICWGPLVQPFGYETRESGHEALYQ